MLKEIKKIINKLDKTKYNDFEKLFCIVKELGLLKSQDKDKFLRITTKTTIFDKKKRLEKIFYIVLNYNFPLNYPLKIDKKQIKKDYNRVGFKITNKEINNLLKYNEKYRLRKKEGEGNSYCEEECPNCDDGIVKTHKILSKEKKLLCLECGYKQDYEVI